MLTDCKVVAEVQCSPSWFRLHPKLPVLYCTNETFDGSDSSVTAFGLTPSGGLERMGKVSTGGGSACHLSVHVDGAYMAVANHGQVSQLLSLRPILGVTLQLKAALWIRTLVATPAVLSQ